MGDNRRDYVVLADALDEMFRSANAGYVVLGSDVGGYLDRDDKDLSLTIPFDTEVFARWTAIGGLSPFMQLHGRANITPWTSGDDWYDFWNPTSDALTGGQTLTGVDATDWMVVPLYLRRGAIIPLAVDDDATGLGDSASANHLTVLVYPGASSTFTLHDTDEKITTIAGDDVRLERHHHLVARDRGGAAPCPRRRGLHGDHRQRSGCERERDPRRFRL